MWPGVPAAGHVTSGGAWHPGAISSCSKCDRHDYEPGDVTHPMHTDPNCRHCGEAKHS